MKTALLREKLSALPEINVERGLRYSVDNIKNYRKALYMAYKSIKFKLPLIANMLDEQEYEGLGIIAHTLAQLLDNIGAESLVEECTKMETLLLNDRMEEIEASIESYTEDLADFMIRLEDAIPAIDMLASSKQFMEDDAQAKLERRSNLVQELYPNQRIV